jgi:hypothetical protein
MRQLIIVLVLLCWSLSAWSQSAGNDFKSHILWEREFQGIPVSVEAGATVDHEGGLWFVSEFREKQRLVHLSPEGSLITSQEFPAFMNARPPAENVAFALAALPSGRIGILATYDHVIGKGIYSDGAAFANFDEGKISAPKKVAGPGPGYNGFLALSDDHFLVVGDQEPMVLIRIGPQGETTWRRTFPSKWDLPSGAALENGASCVVSAHYLAPRLHLLRLNSSGVVQHQAEFSGQNAVAAAGPSCGCAILYDYGKHLPYHVGFFLTTFDASFKREWTVPVVLDAGFGDQFFLVTLSDGYLAVVDTSKDSGHFFIAKYDFSGRVVWAFAEKSTTAPNAGLANGDDFYLIGEGQKGFPSLGVIKGH